MKDSNANNGLITKIWGPGFWMAFHSTAFGYPLDPTEENKKDYLIFYQTIAKILPCKYCRDSYSQFIKEPELLLDLNVMKDRETLTRWTYEMHNRVNKKLGVNYGLSFEDVKDRFECYRAKCSSTANKKYKGCVIPLSKKNGYIVADIKDCPIISYEDATLFIPLARERGLNEKEINLLEILKKYNDVNNNCTLWVKRNKYCERLINNMRKKNIPNLEHGGKYNGQPTIEELKLIMGRSTTICKDDFDKLINNMKKI